VFCSQCGASNTDDATRCTQCGRDLNAPIQATPSAVISPGQPVAVNVPNYLVPAILVTVLCCLFTGIPAIVYAAQVNGKLATGDVVGAQLASKNAKMWCWISVGAGLLCIVFYVMAGVLGFISRRH
jgi:Interferon-induced transmembrane protein/zinc-ribbon domain